MLDRNSQLVDDTRGTNPFPHSRPSHTQTSAFLFLLTFMLIFYCLVYPLTHFSLHFTMCSLIPVFDSPSYYMLTFPLSFVASVGHVCFFISWKQKMFISCTWSQLTGESSRLVVCGNTTSGVLNCTDGLFSSQGCAWSAFYSAYYVIPLSTQLEGTASWCVDMGVSQS